MPGPSWFSSRCSSATATSACSACACGARRLQPTSRPASRCRCGPSRLKRRRNADAPPTSLGAGRYRGAEHRRFVGRRRPGQGRGSARAACGFEPAVFRHSATGARPRRGGERAAASHRCDEHRAGPARHLCSGRTSCTQTCRADSACCAGAAAPAVADRTAGGVALSRGDGHARRRTARDAGTWRHDHDGSARSAPGRWLCRRSDQLRCRSACLPATGIHGRNSDPPRPADTAMKKYLDAMLAMTMRRGSTALALALALTLGGCAQQRIRDESQMLLRDAQFEKAIATLELGLKDHPDSNLLRAGILQARNEAMSRLLAEAAAARSAGRLDDAEAALKRAAPFDTGGKRVDALLFDLATERRQRKALAEAEALAAKKQPEVALRVIADALKDAPRQSELLALQRRLEVEARQAQVRAAQQGLSETRPISLDFRDASLRTVLDVVTRNSGVNFILDKDIRPETRVTVFLRSARVEDAIDLIISTHQLAKKVIDGQTILIYPNTPEKQREHQEQVIRVFYLASAEAKNAAAFLRSMLKIRDPYVDERSNMLAIREARENVELAERLIALYDTNEPEVLLELEVIEIRTNRLTELGVQFPDSFSLTPLGPRGAAGGLTLAN